MAADAACKQDPAKALFWFNLAAAGGHPDGERLRDQHRSQVNRGLRQKIDEEAVWWKAHHPQRYTCKRRALHFPPMAATSALENSPLVG